MNLATRTTFALLFPLTLAGSMCGQPTVNVDGPSFEGTLHDNVSNRERQGSGFTPLILKSFPGKNLFRDEAVGLNFEHIFNGAKAQHDISMFTPRRDRSELNKLGGNRYEIHWPAEGSAWGLDARMIHDFSAPHQIDLTFECTPTHDRYPQKFAAMMWASYMNRTIDRRIHFWGSDGGRTGWVSFGEDVEGGFETGTVAADGVPNLPYEDGAQTLNLVEHSTKKFINPFYYGLIDGDQNLQTTDDRLLFLVMFDQVAPIRFAMWNFIKDENNQPDTHSPAWDWQYVIRNPVVDGRYGYRARIVVRPFEGVDQVWNEYRRWVKEMELDLPKPPTR